MAELKWVQEPDGRWTGSADGIDHHAGRGIDAEGKLIIQMKHDYDIAKIAEANEYVRVTQSFTVVERADLKTVLCIAQKASWFDVHPQDQLAYDNAEKRIRAVLETKS